MKKEEINKYLIKVKSSIKDALKQMDEVSSKTLFVIHKNSILLGSVSDGDIRRAILKGFHLDKSITDIMNRKPTLVGEDYNIKTVKSIILKKRFNAIPVINEKSQIVDILFWDKIFKGKRQKFSQINLPVVIMAGGKGTRLDPFTRILPKPLIPVGNKAMIEVIMDEYARYGMKNFYISINHKGRMIRAYFEEHESDYTFQYITEDKPLGTAGALKYLSGKINTPFFISNCDICIKEDYTKIYKYHQKGGFILTLVASMQNHIIPYGICEIENSGELKKIIEKPQYDFLINTGMYLLNPEALKYIPKNKYFHITYLIEELQKAGYKIGVFPVSEKSWIDIGQWEKYKKVL